MRCINNISDQDEHHDAKYLDENVHCSTGFFEKKQSDRRDRAYDRTVLDRNIKGGVQAEARTRDVADVENKAARCYKSRENVAAAFDSFVRNVLSTLSADGQDAPDV